MKIEEITKKIIEELKNSNQLNYDEKTDELEYDENSDNTGIKDEKSRQTPLGYESNSQEIKTDFIKQNKTSNLENILSQEEFLIKLKERILVLFEGLHNFEKGDIEARVELSLKFMEFLLANIDKQLSNIKKQ